jgi:hypothetical protein
VANQSDPFALGDRKRYLVQRRDHDMIARVACNTTAGRGMDEPSFERAVGRLQNRIFDADLIRPD